MFMRLFHIGLLGLIFQVAGAQAQTVVGTLDDIMYWVGTGSNRAGLVIDWNDGTARESFAWGYRWDGSASGADMLFAIAAADAELSFTNGGTQSSNFFLSSVLYFDGTTAHSGVTPPTFSEYWAYFGVGGTAGGTFAPDVYDPVAGGGNLLPIPAGWVSLPTGASFQSFGAPGRLLADGAWDAWVFGEFGTLPSDTVFAAIPEPGTGMLIAISVIGGICWCLRKRANKLTLCA
jgi:hypothetical protein